MPVGFKNGTDGDVQVAVDALPRLGGQPHVLRRHGSRRRRGGDDGGQPRHARDPARRPQRPQLLVLARDQGARPDLGGRACHAASWSTPATATAARTTRRQIGVAESLAEQMAGGEHGLVGVMLESFLVAGRQKPGRPGDPDLRPVRHRRLHGHRDDGVRAGDARCVGAGPPRLLIRLTRTSSAGCIGQNCLCGRGGGGDRARYPIRPAPRRRMADVAEVTSARIAQGRRAFADCRR